MAIPVLVADDSKLSRRSVIRSLPPELEYDITEATNGQEAIDALSGNTYSLLLLDLTMPEKDGVRGGWMPDGMMMMTMSYLPPGPSRDERGGRSSTP